MRGTRSSLAGKPSVTVHIFSSLTAPPVISTCRSTTISRKALALGPRIVMIGAIPGGALIACAG